MAKVKQKRPVQEFLKEAIIPNNQAPFSIPDNWYWVKVGSVANLYTGNSINEKIKADKYMGLEKGRTYIATKNISFDSVIDYDTGVKIPYNEKNFKVAPINSVLLCIEGGSAGRKIGYLNQDVCFVNKLCCFDFYECNTGLYGYYFLQSAEFFKLFNDRKVGLIGGVSVNNLKDIPFPYAPMEEQQRIVDKIGALFSKLDEAKELIQKSLDEFENRKAAILYKAIHGQLIKKTTSWNKVILNDVVYEFQYGTSKKSEKRGKAIVIRMGNLQAGKIDWNDLAYSNDDEDILKYKLQKGDVLFNRTNSAALVGKTSIYEDERLAIFAGYLIRLKYDKNLIIGRFLNYLLNSQDAKEYCSRVKTDAVNQSNINAKKIAMFSFMLPSLEEQQEIVRILDSFFEKEDKSKELLDMIDQIEEMKKSILSRAFRGELGTHSDSDEPAIELVKRILPDKNI